MPILFNELDTQKEVSNITCFVIGNESVDLAIGTASYGEIPILIIGETNNKSGKVGTALKINEVSNIKVSMIFENPATIDILIKRLELVKAQLENYLKKEG